MSATVIEPGSSEWLKLMTASKVGAILGVSPWESPRSIWHKMRGEVASETSAAKERGHYLEPAILAWFFDQHPEFRREPSATVVHRDHPRFAATPDAFAYHYTGDPDPTYPVEAKSDAGDGEFWGEPGTDEIPLYYAAQCMWTMHCTRATRIYVPMITARLEFREYVVDYNAALAATIEAKCVAFLATLDDETAPELDGHVATYEVIRKLNPLLDRGVEVELSTEHARLFTTAYTDAKASEERLRFAKATIAEDMGTAQKATWLGQLIARRQNTSGDTPAIYAAKPLPTIPEESAAA